MKMSIASASFLRAICVCLAVGLGSSWFLQLPAEGVELKRAGDNVTTNCAMAQRGSEPGFKDEPTSLSLDVIKKLREEMILIPSGEFLMGAVQNDASAQDDEKPRHLVKISNVFFIGVKEVTQSQFEAVMGVCLSCRDGISLLLGQHL
jgi:formylglycine-generating enzyme required for sulfatase activity